MEEVGGNAKLRNTGANASLSTLVSQNVRLILPNLGWLLFKIWYKETQLLPSSFWSLRYSLHVSEAEHPNLLLAFGPHRLKRLGVGKPVNRWGRIRGRQLQRRPTPAGSGNHPVNYGRFVPSTVQKRRGERKDGGNPPFSSRRSSWGACLRESSKIGKLDLEVALFSPHFPNPGGGGGGG